MTIQQQYGRDIWRQLLQCSVNHCTQTINADDLDPETKIESLFPQSTDRLRFTHFMLDMFQLVNTLANAHLAIDYPKNTEYHQFGALKDVWIYFIHRLEEEPVETDSTPSSGMGVILPFKPKS